MIDLGEYQIFSENRKTLRETSMDDSNISDIQYMIQSEVEVIDFDQVKRKYANSLGLTEEVALSVDTIIQFKDHISFVEFKNGHVNNRNIKDKVRDSLLIFLDITGKTISCMRQEAELIVVYNIEKNPLPNQIKKICQESLSRVAIANYFTAKAQKEFILFDLERFEKLYFKKVHTYSKEAFEEYLNDQLLNQSEKRV